MVCETEFDRHIAAFDEACFVQAFAERGHNTYTQLRHTGIHKSNHRHCRLLSARCQRPRHGHAAEQRYERAPLYSITSSAMASTSGGTVRPSAPAVFMLMTISNLVGCSTGRSAGFSPFRIRPARMPIWRYASAC